ncbi:uracil-DNA glycosylase family protein [Prosthecodimorpha staleyi]|uniref:Uracil-DNA glycosylase family protein n=1 Tax=Prosthecodimorpha staleyi TaxID=2840188 RepID=A0A947D6M2_9HYPH|nr:uracil-DNA glycosylase family protein [Prosthecodimorpha staleyi]MBT9290531.1 uracil-DNA glycosylase family protein [Prosthecodimorpha staleyi]
MSATSPDPIAELDLAIRACRICRDAPTGTPLPHEPRPVAHLSATARILVAGQAPGTKVHASGLPFDDASGDRLRDWMGIGRDLFYDTSRIAFLPMGFCFPGQDAAGSDLPPRRECAPAWRARAVAAMPAVELVLAVGQYAQVWHLGRLKLGGMTETVARWREIMAATARPRILPLPHPSWRNTGWLKRHPWFGTDLLPALRADIARLTA